MAVVIECFEMVTEGCVIANLAQHERERWLHVIGRQLDARAKTSASQNATSFSLNLTNPNRLDDRTCSRSIFTQSTEEGAIHSLSSSTPLASVFNMDRDRR